MTATTTPQPIPTAACDIPTLSVPASHIWAAAQFASTDRGRGAIQAIKLEVRPRFCRLIATNGHIAIRAKFSGPDGALPEADILLRPDVFRKLAPSTRAVEIIRDNGQIRCSWWAGASRVSVTDAEFTHGYEYPDADAVWPGSESLHCKPEAPVAFNAQYMALISKVAERCYRQHSERKRNNYAIKISTGSPSTPAQIELNGAPLGVGERLAVQFLIMPVAIRD